MLQALLSGLGDESAMRKKSSELKKKQNQKLPNNLKIIREQDELIRNLNAQLEKGRARFAEEMKQLRDDHAKKLKQMNEELVNMKKTFGCSAKVGNLINPDTFRFRSQLVLTILRTARTQPSCLFAPLVPRQSHQMATRWSLLKIS